MKILIVDDEKNVRRILKDYLVNEGYDVLEAQNGEDGLDKLLNNRDIDLVLLDVRMPIMDGFETIVHMKACVDVPVIFLTALDESYDEMKGLDLGADDYITKPFSYGVLIARVKACLRKNSKIRDRYIEVGSLKIDCLEKEVYRDEKPCHLTQKEYEVLYLLVSNKGMTIERQTMLDRIWGYDYEGESRTVDTHLKTLRAKLGPFGADIITVRGVGYRFETKH